MLQTALRKAHVKDQSVKPLLFIMILLLIVPFVTFGEDSQCVSCHTSGRQLITTAREIQAEIGDQPTKSTESVGEG